MDIIVNNQVVRTITDTEYKIITHTIIPEEFAADMQRRYIWAHYHWQGELDKFKNPCNCIIQLKINNNIFRIRKAWENKIANPAEDNMEFCEQVFAHPDYENRQQREEREKMIMDEIGKGVNAYASIEMIHLSVSTIPGNDEQKAVIETSLTNSFSKLEEMKGLKNVESVRSLNVDIEMFKNDAIAAHTIIKEKNALEEDAALRIKVASMVAEKLKELGVL